MMRTILFASLVVIACGCASTQIYRPGRSWRVVPEAPAQVTDGDIREAFDARPQMPASPRVAYFAFDRKATDALGAMIRELPGVDGVYEIAPLFVTGQRRYEEDTTEPSELDTRRLRLAAARAQCDLLVIVDNGYRVTTEVNGWFAFAPLIVPLLFAPYIDTQVDSYVDAYVVDVRNGYLYGHLTSREEGRSTENTTWANVAEQLADEQWSVLLGRTRRALESVFEQERGAVGGAG